MDSKTYKKIHEAQIQRLKDECEKRVDSGIIVAERYNPEWIEDCDKFIAHRCKDMARNGFVQVLDDAVHQMATDYFNDELHGKWQKMKFDGLGDCKNDEDDAEDDPEEENEKKVKETLEHKIAMQHGEIRRLNDENAKRGSKIIKLDTELKEAKKALKKAEKEAEIAKKAAEKVKKEPKIEKNPVIAPNHDQYDLFAMAGV